MAIKIKILILILMVLQSNGFYMPSSLSGKDAAVTNISVKYNDYIKANNVEISGIIRESDADDKNSNQLSINSDISSTTTITDYIYASHNKTEEIDTSTDCGQNLIRTQTAGEDVVDEYNSEKIEHQVHLNDTSLMPSLKSMMQEQVILNYSDPLTNMANNLSTKIEYDNSQPATSVYDPDNIINLEIHNTDYSENDEYFREDGEISNNSVNENDQLPYSEEENPDEIVDYENDETNYYESTTEGPKLSNVNQHASVNNFLPTPSTVLSSTHKNPNFNIEKSLEQISDIDFLTTSTPISDNRHGQTNNDNAIEIEHENQLAEMDGTTNENDQVPVFNNKRASFDASKYLKTKTNFKRAADKFSVTPKPLKKITLRERRQMATSLERAERRNKVLQRLLGAVNIVGHVDSYISGRLRNGVKKISKLLESEEEVEQSQQPLFGQRRRKTLFS